MPMLISPVLVNSIPSVALEFVAALRADLGVALAVCHAPSLPWAGQPGKSQKAPKFSN